MAPILLTTFAPWKAHQPSNSSDDLVAHVMARSRLPRNVVLMRQVPVNFQLAPCHVISRMVALRPKLVICCGMAETQSHLHLELNGQGQNRILQTSLPLESLLWGTHLTEISLSAGDYVCNHLYFKVLDFIERHRWPAAGLFIHIPRLTPINQPWIADDFVRVIERLNAWTKPEKHLQAA